MLRCEGYAIIQSGCRISVLHNLPLLLHENTAIMAAT